MHPLALPDPSPQWLAHIDAWLDWYRSGAASSGTVYQRGYQIRRFARAHDDRDPFSLTSDDLAAWLAAHDWSRETLRSARAALRSFYGWAHATGRVASNPAALLRPVRPRRGYARPISERDLAAAERDADDRARLAIDLGARHGLRRAEIAQVHTRDVTERRDGYWLLVHGKGDRERHVPIDDRLARRIERAEGWLFPNGRGSHLTPAHLGKIVRRALPGDVTTHQLRHRFGVVAYQNTRDIRAVQELLGHASVATTQTYTASDSGAARRAIESAA